MVRKGDRQELECPETGVQPEGPNASLRVTFLHRLSVLVHKQAEVWRKLLQLCCAVTARSHWLRSLFMVLAVGLRRAQNQCLGSKQRRSDVHLDWTLW